MRFCDGGVPCARSEGINAEAELHLFDGAGASFVTHSTTSAYTVNILFWAGLDTDLDDTGYTWVVDSTVLMNKWFLSSVLRATCSIDLEMVVEKRNVCRLGVGERY